MADQKKPKALADDDLDGATGGFGSWGEPVGTLKDQARQGDGDSKPVDRSTPLLANGLSSNESTIETDAKTLRSGA